MYKLHVPVLLLTCFALCMTGRKKWKKTWLVKVWGGGGGWGKGNCSAPTLWLYSKGFSPALWELIPRDRVEGNTPPPPPLYKHYKMLRFIFLIIFSPKLKRSHYNFHILNHILVFSSNTSSFISHHLRFLPFLHQEHLGSVYSPNFQLPNKVKPNTSSGLGAFHTQYGSPNPSSHVAPDWCLPGTPVIGAPPDVAPEGEAHDFLFLSSKNSSMLEFLTRESIPRDLYHA